MDTELEVGARNTRGLALRGGEVVALDALNLLGLVLSGPLLISAVVAYFTATILLGIHVPKTLGVDLGYYTKLHYPSLYHGINRALLPWTDRRQPSHSHKIPVWKTYFTDEDGVTIPYQVYEEIRV